MKHTCTHGLSAIFLRIGRAREEGSYHQNQFGQDKSLYCTHAFKIAFIFIFVFVNALPRYYCFLWRLSMRFTTIQRSSRLTRRLHNDRYLIAMFIARRIRRHHHVTIGFQDCGKNMTAARLLVLVLVAPVLALKKGQNIIFLRSPSLASQVHMLGGDAVSIAFLCFVSCSVFLFAACITFSFFLAYQYRCKNSCLVFMFPRVLLPSLLKNIITRSLVVISRMCFENSTREHSFTNE